MTLASLVFTLFASLAIVSALLVVFALLAFVLVSPRAWLRL